MPLRRFLTTLSTLWSKIIEHYYDIKRQPFSLYKSSIIFLNILRPLKLSPTKSSLRTIYLTDPNVQEIEKYKVWVSEKILKVSKRVVASTSFVFDIDLGVLHRSASRRRWETILKQAGLKHRGFHS